MRCIFNGPELFLMIEKTFSLVEKTFSLMRNICGKSRNILKDQEKFFIGQQFFIGWEFFGRLRINFVYLKFFCWSRIFFVNREFANNLANTVLHCFVNGTQEFGLPFCVRGDRGVENVDVASFIIQNRWLNRGSSSVVAVFITRELNVYGQKSTEWYLSFTETSLFSWKRMVFLIQPMNRIYLPSIMFICHPYRLLWMNLSTSELLWFMYYE